VTNAGSKSAVLRPRARWRQYSLRTLLCAVVLLAVLSCWPYLDRCYVVSRLQEYYDTDIRDLPDAESRRIDRWVAKLCGQERTSLEDLVGPKTWLLHRSRAAGLERKTYVIQMEPTLSIPGSSYCHFHVLDSWGYPIRSMMFNVGYRARPTLATCDESQHGFLCLTVETDAMWWGKTRQFYRITDEYAELLRSERLDGTFAMGNGNVFEIAEKPGDWSDWEQLIESPDCIQQLRGLAALWSSDNLSRSAQIQEKLWRRLEHLSVSRDPWISEESKAALKLLAEHGVHRTNATMSR
jgi:hypothetical protein